MTGPRLSIIPARAATDRALKPGDLQVLCVLGRHTDDLGWCRKSQVKMAEEMGCARSTVFDAVERLVAAGYLERFVQEEDNGRDSPHVYRVILDPKHPCPGAVKDGEPGTADRCERAAPPADRSAPPADISAPPAGPGPAPKNDLLRTTHQNEEERERAGEREEGQPESTDDAKKFESRVKRLAARHAWPRWEKSPTAWTVARFAELTDAERAEAEARAGQYIALCGNEALSLGTYFHDRKWRDLPPPQEPKPLKLDAPPFGPVWAFLRMRALVLDPPRPPPRPASGFIAGLIARDDEIGRRERLSRQAKYGWPQVNALDDAAARRRTLAVEPELEAMKPLMEPVPVDSATFTDWRNYHTRRGWPWLPDPGGMRVVYFPAGGPGALDGFERALRREDDAGRAHAAE